MYLVFASVYMAGLVCLVVSHYLDTRRISLEEACIIVMWPIAAVVTPVSLWLYLSKKDLKD